MQLYFQCLYTPHYCKIECNLMTVITCNYRLNNRKPNWTVIAQLLLSWKIWDTEVARFIALTKYINLLTNTLFNERFVILYSYVST